MNINTGDLVLVTTSFMGCKSDSVGIVYESYPSILILEDGTDLGGFSIDECRKYLIKISPTNNFYSSYKFKSVIKLSEDFNNGTFGIAQSLAVKINQQVIRDIKLNKIGI